LSVELTLPAVDNLTYSSPRKLCLQCRLGLYNALVCGVQKMLARANNSLSLASVSWARHLLP